MRINKLISLIKTVNIEAEIPTIESELSLMDLNKNYFKKLYLFYRELTELTKLGAVVKDVKIGLVDFYYKHEGKDVLLCWKYGEKQISHWHEVETGYDARKSIDSLKHKKDFISKDFDSL